MVEPHGATDRARVDPAAVVAVVLLVALAGALAITAGFGPLDVDGSSSGPTGSTGSADSVGSGSAGNSSTDGASGGTSEPPPFGFDVLKTERCGNTCRDVTVRLTNRRDARASDVVVTTRIYSGNTTADGARVWERRREVGTLEAGASTTATERVSLSYFEALSVERKGGWITLVTTVESAEATTTFRERRKVA